MEVRCSNCPTRYPTCYGQKLRAVCGTIVRNPDDPPSPEADARISGAIAFLDRKSREISAIRDDWNPRSEA